MISQRISQPFPQPQSLLWPEPPPPQQQISKRGSRQLEKEEPDPQSHPLFLVFWQFVAAKSLILSYLQYLFTVYTMPEGKNVSLGSERGERGIIHEDRRKGKDFM